MNTYTRVSNRSTRQRLVLAGTSTLYLLACAVALLLAFTAGPARAAVNATVNLRVEAPNETLFNEQVSTGPRVVSGGVDSPACRADAQSVNYSNSTVFTAIHDAFGPTGYRSSGGFYSFGTLICSIGSYSVTSTDYWFVKVNNLASPPPAGYVSADTELENGDDVLVYYDVAAAGNTKTLALSLPPNALPGQTVSGTVSAYNNSTDVKSPAAGAQISGGGVTATANLSGLFSLSIPQGGRFLVSATLPNAIRGSAYITIDPSTPAPVPAVPVPVAPQPRVRINRFKKCAATYRKGSRKHRRCIRIVRAKQAAEKRRAARNRRV